MSEERELTDAELDTLLTLWIESSTHNRFWLAKQFWRTFCVGVAVGLVMAGCIALFTWIIFVAA